MKTISITWSTDDVLMEAEQMDVVITEAEAEKILDDVYRFHDAEVGISWNVINFHIENFVDNNGKKNN